ncbi:hypothetical protein CERZMDRAFT_59383 [Cercospora zeae-maydis SCOH1-5]|uniref:WSC domain-containing protein n=1 Tax=Cercospora zeae-maydis SCOH1-5 TaxID=717836 RepID=A0A6A6FET6_9PEZI|nr:hypothetical protein CERZMDRAFT_59383 [Cercospora zeae-maydis SCOH1-5]
MESVGTYTYQSSGYCSQQCAGKNAGAMATTNGNDCWCGGEIPADSDKVDDSKCNTPCTGYGQDSCTCDRRACLSDTEATPSLVTNISPGKTVVVTVAPSSSSSSTSSSSSASSAGGGGGGGGGSNTAGIAAGVVVGVVGLAAAIGGLFFWMRQKKRKEAEEEYRQRTAVSDFMRGANERKPPSTGYSHMSDTRLDPEAGARKNSCGSLADNQDYSRRILRVANPDSS